ncbi:Vacuolar protein-sorting-associated protein 25 [Hondaea fermentalgiana]|uniref:Vacuolar protein-sorting-associated protein 25 n=1 Tax=Hondaea fermentalgiana TaxID=2315210 RepID=A0A2R5GIE5_9STRA|nr:Vacuolar protein-sorting-associated protein 25 [Hondaea fermentalgiana]|eukprot:GBG27644.1 Vacuolar protein-sorting-associated protein 25 [Hondaea fermentalgiana]
MEKAPTEAEFHAKFKAFYTLQDNEATRLKQVRLWRRLVLEDFARQQQQQQRSQGADAAGPSVLSLDSFPLFTNAKLDRALDAAGRKAVADDLVASGHGQWHDAGKTLYVFVKTPSEWASIIYDFVQQNGLGGTIYTVYELHSGDLTRNTPIQGIEPALCIQALEILENQNKAEVYPSDESLDETGVKFI